LKIGPKKYRRALFIVERAMDLVGRKGIVEPVRNHGFARQGRPQDSVSSTRIPKRLKAMSTTISMCVQTVSGKS